MVTHRWTTVPGALALILICSPTVPALAQDVERGVDTLSRPATSSSPSPKERGSLDASVGRVDLWR